MRVVIVGGVAGGMSAATRLRRLNEEAEICVIEKSGHVSYANCGLPYFVGGVIDDEEKLLLQTPESLHARFRLDVRVNSEVVAIDSISQVVTVHDLQSHTEYTLSYDKLILSPGASPIVPAIPGIDRALTLRTVEDVELIVAQVAKQPNSAVVIGGGFIGIEVAENLIHRGIKTTVVEAGQQVLAALDPEMASLVHIEIRNHGVDLRLNVSAQEVTDRSVKLSDESEVAADLVILAIGVRPETSLAKSAGLDIGPRGGVRVDAFNVTSNKDIYAIGDAAEKIDALDGGSTLVPLANIANRHGRVVADHILNRAVRPVHTIGTAIVKVFDLTVATTGWNEKRLRVANRSYACLHTHPNSHAGYYPDAKQMSLKLIFDKSSGEILGAQGVGIEGVDKRIDVIATAMRGGITAPELADLELAYAPPFGSAKDPVNMLGFIAENILTGLIETVQWNEVDDFKSKGYFVLDVRSEPEFALGCIDGAVNIPVDQLRDRHTEISNEKILVYCQVGQRGHTATLLLNELGFRAVNLDGGYQLWSKSERKGE